MATQWMIETAIWASRRFARLTDRAIRLYMHLRTGPVRTWSGLYEYALDPMMAGAGLSKRSGRAAMKELTMPYDGEEPLVMWDEDRDTVWVVDGFGIQPQNRESHKGAVRDILRCKRSPLVWAFMHRYPECQQVLAEMHPDYEQLLTPRPPPDNPLWVGLSPSPSLSDSRREVEAAPPRAPRQAHLVDKVLAWWNSRPGLIQHRMSTQVRDAINRALNTYGYDKTLEVIDTYALVLGNQHFLWSHSWTLVELVTRRRATEHWWELERKDCLRKWLMRGEPLDVMDPLVPFTVPAEFSQEAGDE